MLVFARGKAKDPYDPERAARATYANDPNETQIQYDLYRMPFNDGQGGTPEPRSPGASDNGMSNTFPKVSPDGKWIVFVKCQNGQLMRPDGRLWIVPFEGGEARRDDAATPSLMNSWHSFSPNGRWMVFSSQVEHALHPDVPDPHRRGRQRQPADPDPERTAANRAVNLPEFVNAPYDALQKIDVPAANHYVDFQRGYELLHEGRVEEARPFLEQAIAQEPGFSRAHAALGRLYQTRGSPELARTHYEASLAANARNARVLTNLGLLLYHQGEVDHALELWRRAIEVDPYDHLAHSNLALALGARGRLDEATRHVERALEIAPDFVDGHATLGLLALQGGHVAEARRHLDHALELDPKFVKARIGLATLFEQTGRIADAIEQYETVLRQDADSLKARTRAAWLLATTAAADVRDGPAALAHARRAVELTGARDAVALDVLAAALAETGELGGAVEAAERAAASASLEDRELLGGIRERLRLYRRGRPYRAPR